MRRSLDARLALLVDHDNILKQERDLAKREEEK
jgi:hypothetical protein